MVSWFVLPLVALSVILSLTDGRGLPRPEVVMGPYGNPLMFMRDKRTPIGIYPRRSMMLTGYYRPIRQSYTSDQATAVFAQGNAVNGAAYLGGGDQPNYLNPGPEPATEPEIANSEAEAAPQPEGNLSEGDGDQNEVQVQGQGNREHHNEPQDEINDSNTDGMAAPEESTETAVAPPKKTGTKKEKKVVLPVRDEQEDDEDEDEYDDNNTGEIVPLVPQKGKRRQQYPSRNIFFPMIFGYPGSSSRSGSSGSIPGSITAIANSYSTGKGGVANSVATAYGGSPQKKPRRPRPPNAED